MADSVHIEWWVQMESRFNSTHFNANMKLDDGFTIDQLDEVLAGVRSCLSPHATRP